MLKAVTLVGIDLAKNIFWVRAEDEFGKVVVDRKISRGRLIEVVSLLKPSQVAMEACGGAHYWGRRFGELGIAVVLLPPQYVRPFRQRDKNDRNDARAICEACRRPGVKPVRVKSTEQQDLQLVLNDRAEWVARRTEISNRLRGALLEYGMALPPGVSKLVSGVRELISNSSSLLTLALRQKIERDLEELSRLNLLVKELDRQLSTIAKTDFICRKLVKLAGVGPVIAVALRAAITNPFDYKNGRQAAAWMGLVPRQHSSGGKTRLLGISKQGNRYLRQLLIHGARSVLKNSTRHSDPLSQWAERKKKELGFNKACVAVANKNARMLWAVMAKTARKQQAA